MYIGQIVYVPDHDQYGIIVNINKRTRIGYVYDVMLEDRSVLTTYDFMIETEF